jgi:hypothetical protein
MDAMSCNCTLNHAISGNVQRYIHIRSVMSQRVGRGDASSDQGGG